MSKLKTAGLPPTWIVLGLIYRKPPALPLVKLEPLGNVRANRNGALMRKTGLSKYRIVLTVFGAALLLASTCARAVPSFARQTGMACEACHTVFPELTPFGRRFKMYGYTVDNLPQVSGINGNKDQTLVLNQVPPLSFMFQTSYTKTKAALPDSQQGAGNVPADALAKNGQVLFPQQASLFYAGRIAPNFGAFVQMTYDGTSATFGWDNTDVRYAMPVNENLVFGLSFNNNPTVQDLWNTTPAWQSPFDQRSATAPTPGMTTMIDGGLADAGVAGLSVYASFADGFYGELGAYHSAPAAAQIDSTSSNVVSGLAPYWRFAYERQWSRNSWEVGVYGTSPKVYAGGGAALSGPTDNFRDIAVDSQYQYIGDDHLVTVIGTWIDEKRTLNATYAAGGATNLSGKLRTLRLSGSYYYQRTYGASFGVFSTTGSSDPLLYAQAPLSGYANNTPQSRGWTGELDWVPYQNTKLALQYTAYSRFNGGRSNYDGANRSAGDNNTLYLLGWFNF